MKTTLELYRVKPDHFDYMLYWDAIRSKIRLAEKAMEAIHDKTSTMTYGSEKYDELYEIYKASEKAKKYNQELIKERKQYAKNKGSKKE